MSRLGRVVTVMFESLSTRLQDVFRDSRRGTAHAREHRGGAARDPAGAARSRRQLQGRQGVHRPRPRPGDGPGRAPQPDAVAAGRQDRPRRDGGALRRRRRAACQPTSKRPRVILLLGLQGAGKTTTAGKLAKWLTKQGRHPLLVSTDVKRPAAIQQLNVVGEKAGVRVHDPAGRDGSGGAREGRGGRSEQPRVRRRHRRHRRPAAHRRRADGRAAWRSRTRSRPVGPAVRRRRDDRAGRDQERRRVQPARSASPASC